MLNGKIESGDLNENWFDFWMLSLEERSDRFASLFAAGAITASSLSKERRAVYDLKKLEFLSTRGSLIRSCFDINTPGPIDLSNINNPKRIKKGRFANYKEMSVLMGRLFLNNSTLRGDCMKGLGLSVVSVNKYHYSQSRNEAVKGKPVRFVVLDNDEIASEYIYNFYINQSVSQITR